MRLLPRFCAARGSRQTGEDVARAPATAALMSRLLAAALVFLAGPAHAQLAVGGQLGDPTGLSLKVGTGTGALALAVGWDLDDSVSAEGHYLLRARRIQGSDADLRLFYGPGVFLRSGDGDTDLGVSLGVGLETSLTREIELYGLVSPRLRLVEDTDFDLGGGVGVRLRL